MSESGPDNIIEFQDVWESFELPGQRVLGLKQGFLDLVKGQTRRVDHFHALRGISFSISRGEIVGIVGENGSGKTTLLNLIAGIYQPDRGSVRIGGKVSALLELGTGFHPELTGRENISLTGSLLGLDKQTLEQQLPAILEFAEIGDFIDVPVKTYSTGMYVRLAFALAISVPSEILLIDEVLSVGDISFQQKCIARILEIRDAGTTILFVSHDMHTVKGLCNRVLLLKEGRIVRDGEAQYVLEYFYRTMGNRTAVHEVETPHYSLLFSNGLLALMIDQAFITYDEGLFQEILVADREIRSYAGAWSITSATAKGLIAECLFPLDNLKLIWRIDCDPDGFCLSILIQDLEQTGRKRHISNQLNLKLPDSFKRWQDVLFEHSFEELDGQSLISVQSFGQPLANSTVLQVQDEQGTRLFFELLPSATPGHFHIPKDEMHLPARIIKINHPAPARSNGPGTEPITLEYAYRFEINLPVDLEQEKRQQALHDISLTCADTCLYFNGSQFHILDKNRQITENLGIFSSLYYERALFESHSGQWQLEKNADGIQARVTFANIPVAQNWYFHFARNGQLVLEISFELLRHSDRNLNQFHLSALFSPHYTHWSDVIQHDVFPDVFPDDQEWTLIGKQLNNASIIHLMNPDNQSSILVENGSTISNMQELLFCAEYAHPAHIIKFVDPQPQLTLNQMNHYSFHFSLNHSEKYVQTRKERYLERISLKRSGLILIFTGTQFHLYQHDHRLTKNLGLYTSIYAQNQWHDSHQAQWDLTHQDKCLVGQCQLKKLPVKQYWYFFFNDQDQLIWKIEYEVLKPFRLNRMQTNIMLDEWYSNWANGLAEHGLFPERFADDFGGEWEIISSHKSEKGDISASTDVNRAENKPRISLNLVSPRSDFQANIVNSDSFFRSRVLQMLKTPSAGQEEQSPGRYLYSECLITVSPLT
ncbi:ABC transporter ATP-binding protein [bacterium]|nr:ABC transporter ATP-binding protein [bacterium]